MEPGDILFHNFPKLSSDNSYPSLIKFSFNFTIFFPPSSSSCFSALKNIYSVTLKVGRPKLSIYPLLLLLSLTKLSTLRYGLRGLTFVRLNIGEAYNRK